MIAFGHPWQYGELMYIFDDAPLMLLRPAAGEDGSVGRSCALETYKILVNACERLGEEVGMMWEGIDARGGADELRRDI